ncbi:MAG TPA: hypothetical protein VI874_04200 [Candidatus Norongarragalinales archaeon]|nr:hypothetical protein [Candidatus Norongarragalinales archaeon]
MPLELLKSRLAELGYRFDNSIEGGPKHQFPGASSSSSMVTHLFFKPLSEFGPAPKLFREIKGRLADAKRGPVQLTEHADAFCQRVKKQARRDVSQIQADYVSATGHSVTTFAEVVFHAASEKPGVLLKLSIGNAEIQVPDN